jgi:hypothetical protein
VIQQKRSEFDSCCIHFAKKASEANNHQHHKKRGSPMPKFPQTDSELIALAEEMIAGFPENEFFPSPPVSSSDLRNRLDAFKALNNAQVAAQAAAEQATDEKAVGRELLAADMKVDLRYAEYAVAGDDSKLKTIGWSGRLPRNPIHAPGQPFNFQMARSGPGEAKATWERPNEGGPVACYMIERHVTGEEGASWVNAGTFVDNEATLTDQERGNELEFCVIALNRAGESLPSNSVTVVL